MVERTLEADEAREYFFAILSARPDHETFDLDVTTIFIRWGDDDFRTEVRGPRIIQPGWAKNMCEIMKIRLTVVHNLLDLVAFLESGGGALILRETAEQELKSHFKESTCMSHGGGFFEVSETPEILVRKAPTPKLRMRVLKRDNFRCMICGRSPTDHLDLELHVHHIKPTSKRGPTDGNNLITLCNTCHKGLSPHCDADLSKLIGIESKLLNSDEIISRVERVSEKSRDI